MVGTTMLYCGAIVIILWGIAHIAPTKLVVKWFGKISEDKGRIIAMEWVAEGLTLCFIGLLVLLITIFGGTSNPVSLIVYRTSAAMLIVMAGLTTLTGARTSIVPIKMCPFVKAAVAILFFLGSVL